MEENIVLAVFLLLPMVCGILVYLFFKRDRRGKSKRSSWFDLTVGNGLIFILLCSLLLPAGEIYYRFIYDTTDAFGLAKVTQEWFERHYHHNQVGFRDSIEYEPGRPPGKRRISFLGDSFTAGHGVTNVEERFANRIRQTRDDWDVHVWAGNGLDTGHELGLLQELMRMNYEFDQLVLVYCLNDISDIVPEWQTIRQRLYESPGPGFLIEQSYFLNTIYYRLKSARDPDISRYYHFVIDAYEGPPWEQQKLRLTSLRDGIQAMGGRLLVVTFPFLQALGPDSEYRPIHDRLAAFWQGAGVPHLDLLDIFDGRLPEEITVSARDPHPNEQAHAMAAEAISAFVDEQLSLEERSKGNE